MTPSLSGWLDIFDAQRWQAKNCDWFTGRAKELRNGWLLTNGSDYIVVAAQDAASKCRNAKKKLSFSGNGIFTVSQLLQSGIRVSPVPLVTGKSGNAQLWLQHHLELKYAPHMD